MAQEFNIPGLKESIKDLEKFEDLIKKTSKDVLDLAIAGEKAVQANKGNSGLKDNVETQKRANDETTKLEAAKKRLAVAESDYGKKLAEINSAIAKQNQANKAQLDVTEQLNALLKKEVSTISEARAQIALLTQARNNVNVSSEEGRAKLAEYNAMLDKNNKFIKDNADAATKQRMNIGNYAEGVQTALEKTGLYNGKIGDMTRNAIGYATAGRELANKVKDINDSVVTGVKNMAGFVTAKLNLTKATEVATIATEEAAIATEAGTVADNQARAATIGFRQAEVASTAATEANVVITEASTAATESSVVATEAATVATGALDVVLGILVAPLTLVILAFAALVYIFKDFAPLINPIKDAFAQLEAVFGVVKQTIFDLVTGAQSLTDVFSNFGGAVSEAAKSAKELAQEQREINKAMDVNDVQMAQAKTKIQDLILQSKNRSLTEKERIALINQAQKLEEDSFKKTNELNDRSIDAARKKLFEGKNLSDKEIEFIEKNDFAKIRSLKIAKNLDEDELKSYKDLLLKKEDLLQQDQQIREKAQNRKDQLADKDAADKEKADAKALQQAEKEKKAAEEAVKKEEERQKKSFDLLINSKKAALDYTIATYKQEEQSQDENLAYVKIISAQKESIAKLQMQKELVGITKGSLDYKNIVQKNSEEIAKIKLEEQNATEKILVDGAQFEVEVYELKNKSKIESGKTLTDLLVEQEKDRINELFNLQKAALDTEFKLDEEKLKEKLKLGEQLTQAEIKYLKQIKSLEEKKKADDKKLDTDLVTAKQKAIDDEVKSEDRKFKLLEKGTLANSINDLKIEEKKLKEEQKLYKDDAKKQDEIADALAKNKQTYDKLVTENKKQQLNSMLDAVINVAGQESTIGKSMAIAKATMDTYGAANAILKTASESPETVLFPGYPELMVGLTIASGLLNVSKIAGIEMFAEGTDYAPYTGKAIVDEIGAEIHMDKHGNIKSFGSQGGARLTDIVQGDRIIPADISAIIKQSMFAPYQMKGNQQSNIDYAEMGKYFDKSASKIVQAINANGKNQLSVHIAPNNQDRVVFRGKSV